MMPLTPPAAPTVPPAAPPAGPTREILPLTPSADAWRAQLDASKELRAKFVRGIWRENVAFRVQKPFAPGSESDQSEEGVDQIAVPADWSRTRAKMAALFSDLPRVSLEPGHARYKNAIPIFEKITNHFVPRAGALPVMEECSADVVNAAGVCAAIAKYEATFRDEEVPAIDVKLIPPEQLAALLAAKQIPMTTVAKPFQERYRWYRISPSQLLRPVEFLGSDWQRAPWLGYDGELLWPLAQQEFGLTEADKHACCATGERTAQTLSGDVKRPEEVAEATVRFCEIYYWGAGVVPGELRYDAIYRLVFVEGKDDPVVHEPYRGQQWNDQTGEFVGATRLPIEVATLTYISDRQTPPSDSEIGRPMVLEQIRSRSQMILQRTRNLPIRTFDVNRVPPEVQSLLMRGTWQGMFPVNGPGEKAITQIASAAFPREDFTFDQVSNRDLDDAWSMSPNQMGTFTGGERSASEANIIANAYASVIGVQRRKMVQMYLGLVETTMGLLQLNLDDFEAEEIVGPDGVQRLQEWNRQQIAGKFVATCRQDSSVLMDSQQRIAQLMKFLNIAGKSGRINIDPILSEIAGLSGVDPASVLLPPAGGRPEPLNLSIRLSGLAEILNPMGLALLEQSGQAPSPEALQKAAALLQQLGLMGAPPPSQVTAAPVPGGLPLPAPDPNWGAMERVTKRPDELGG